ncbi:MAG TPA: AbrB/MazE/SpoVT family DNA-binding domain-containing protein [Candidatus Thermoplasmatota archaeon]
MTFQSAKISSRGQVVIPLPVRKELKLKTGDAVMFHVEGGQAVMTPLDQARIQAVEDLFAWGRRQAKIRKIRKRDILPAVMEIRYGKKNKK